VIATGRAAFLLLAAIVPGGLGCQARPGPAAVSQPPSVRYTLAEEDDRFLNDLSHRAFRYFWEQADDRTGIVRDRARTDASPHDAEHEFVGSIAATGFGLTALCIGAERGWVPRDAALARTRATLRTFAERLDEEHGWFYHFLDIRTGDRVWKSELSSIDTALLLGGVLSVRECFGDVEIARLADSIYRRVDFQWMLNGDPALLSHGWYPERGFITNRWAEFSEAMILYLLGLGSPTHPLPARSWTAWGRPLFSYGAYTYVHTVPPLFIHQFSHAWVDFRGWRDPVPPQPDWFTNSIVATYAQRQFMLDLRGEFPGYGENLWGLTSSDSIKGYTAWGGPPRHPGIDGSVVPCAPAGSLMFAPEITVPALREMHRRFGDRIYGRYGFADAFNPGTGWVNPDVIGIDVGITLLATENLRTGAVWRWFMANQPIRAAMIRATAASTP
jgi:hypothetical protein